MNFDLTALAPYARLLATVLAVIVILVLRNVAVRAILRNAPKGEVRRSWIVNVRNVTVFTILVVILAIWSGQIAPYTTAVLAFAVAMVIATKEIIQCLLGSFIRTVANTYSIGDRIEIGSHRGDVVDITPLTTTLLEVGPGKSSHLRTGRTVVLPNSKLTDGYVVNESAMRHYVVHTITIPVSRNEDWKRAETCLRDAAEAECAAFIDEARENMAQLEREHGLQGLPLRARVFVDLPEAGKLSLVLRVPSPVGAQSRIEQAILRRFLDQFPRDPAAEGSKGPSPPPDTPPGPDS
jgi:small-conductance mechanosensitive channel